MPTFQLSTNINHTTKRDAVKITKAQPWRYSAAPPTTACAPLALALVPDQAPLSIGLGRYQLCLVLLNLRGKGLVYNIFLQGHFFIIKDVRILRLAPPPLTQLLNKMSAQASLSSLTCSKHFIALVRPSSRCLFCLVDKISTLVSDIFRLFTWFVASI